MKIGVIIPAAGSASRYRGSSPGARHKLDEDLGGRPLLQRTVELFNSLEQVEAIVVAGPHDEQEFADFRLRHGDKLTLLGATLCRGGVSHRWETVKAALAHVPESCTHIAVHDAARPCTRPELIARVLEAAAKFPAVVPAIDVSDTVKRVSEPVEAPAEHDPLAAILGAAPEPTFVRHVETTLDRTRLVAAQTPQVFRADLLRRAYESPDPGATDDASLVERLGEAVVVVEGDPRNIKVTVPADLVLARAILGVRAPAEREVHKRF